MPKVIRNNKNYERDSTIEVDDIKLEDIPPGWWMGCHTKDGMRVKGFSEAEYMDGEKKGTVQRDCNSKPIYAKFTPDVLNKFCSNYKYRYPLYSDDYIYATDGQIAIRIPRKSYVFFFDLSMSPW